MPKEKTKILACAVVIEELRSKLSEGIDCEVLDFGLHRSPEQLRTKLQELIDESAEYNNIVLAYGLCGMAIIGLVSKTSNLIVPRVDDCIAIFLGSRKAYLKEQHDHPGSLFLSKGWIDGRIDDTSPTIQIFERLSNKYGIERAKRMMQVYQEKQPLRHYKRLAFISTSSETDLDGFKTIARERADSLGLDYDEINGSTALIENIACGSWNENFVVKMPGQRISVEDFWIDADKESPPSSFWS
ncbi:MAG: DUF1638 domain-containing protein [Dehalococcoidales bacterium]|nr:MAG: DUF1638 domain-containing protein [Dehalococcoidales bacterium]